MRFESVVGEKPRLATLALAIALGLTACGSSHHQEGGAKPTRGVAARPDPRPKEDANPGITEQVIYYADGSRVIEVHGSLNHDDGHGIYAENILEFCDGPDLVEELLETSGNANSISRSVDYPGCADGKLTPADFRLLAAVK